MNVTMKYLLPKLIFSSFFVFVIFTGTSQEKRDYQQLDQYIANGVKLFDVPGMSVGIIKDGKVVFNKAYGYSNTATGEMVTPGTIFGIASLTKAFTAAGIAMLVDQGQLDWTDKVIMHYPEFRVSDPYITAEMEITDLLSHRSGYQTFDGDLLWYGSDYSREEVLSRIRFRENPFSFRSRFGYQNVMFIAAGEVIRRKTGMSWDSFMAARIFDPLGMYATSTTNSHFFEEELDFAWPHIDGKPVEFINYDNCGPAASINSSVVDMMKWIRLQLGKGIADKNRLFSEESYYKMVAPITMLDAGKAETPGERHFFGCGLGWFLHDYQGRKIIEHGGGLPGFHSKVVLVPEENLGYVILANQISGLVEALYRKILDFHLISGGKDWVQVYYEGEARQNARKTEMEKQRQDSRVTGTSPSLPVEKYSGWFEDKMYGKAEVIVEDGQLSLVMHPSKKLFTGHLEHWHYNTFKVTLNDPFLPPGYVTFSINGNGEADGFTIDLENPDFHFYKLNFVKE
jgi:CubicO group peptidase (beta-lactamase class C family)